eukprot:scaffold2697_cov346-Pavlova_lutheri.AAC.15
MAFLPLPHGNTGTVPVPRGHLGFLVVVVSAGTEGCTQFVLVIRQPFDDHGGHTFVDAEVGSTPLGVLL